MPDDTTKLLTEIRDLLQTNTDAALRNEQRLKTTIESQRRAITRIVIISGIIIALVASFGLWILYEIAMLQGVDI